MCEAMLEYRGSYQQALICVKKAAGYNHSYPDWRIFLCRILLENAKCENDVTVRGAESTPLEEFDPADILSDAMQVVMVLFNYSFERGPYFMPM